MDDIENYLRLSPKFPGDTMLFRGGAYPQHVADSWQVGREVVPGAFWSTSTGRKKAGEYMREAAKKDSSKVPILVKFARHQRGVSVAHLSAAEAEAEVVFPRGARFRIIDRTEKGGRIILTVEEVE